MCINNSGHVTKMVAMPIYGKNPSEFSPELETMHETWMTRVLQCVYINHDPVMALAYFTARST